MENIKEPAYFVEPYKLEDLPDPPDDWEFLGRSYAKLKNDRSTRLSMCDALAKIHLWGYSYPAKGRPKRGEMLRAIWKVFYNQREECRPKEWTDLFLTGRDSGPRLLPYTTQPTPVPVSRFYPWEPSPVTPLPLTYIRPFDAPAGVPDCVISQFLYPLEEPDEAPSPPPGVFNTNGSDILDSLPQVGSSDLKDIALPSPKASGGDPLLSFSAGYEARSMIQAIQRAVFKHTYFDLERDPSAPSHQPLATRIATCEDDLRVVHIGAHSAHCLVRLGQNLDWDGQNGDVVLAYRGRGPVWNNSSCSIDSVIVLGKLLQAGSTVIDRKDHRPQKWSNETKAFVEATNVNWDVLPREVSIKIRDVFWEMLEKTYPFMRVGISWLAFSTVTKELAQFQYHGRDYTIDCACQGGETSSQPYSGNCISHRTVDTDRDGVEVSTLVERVWYGRQYFRCFHCRAHNAVIQERRIEQLPLRLVMNTMSGMYDVKTNSHTDDFEIEYPDSEGTMRKARYRWFGGIYHNDGHARVYFRDAVRGEAESGEVGFYDSQINSGVIAGGFPTNNRAESVPQEWSATGMVIVVYELVLDPSMDDLAAARAGIDTMLKLATNNKSVLRGIDPWKPQVNPIHTPAPRTIPVVADMFYDIDRSQLPGPLDPDPGDFTVRAMASSLHCDSMGGTLAPVQHSAPIPISSNSSGIGVETPLSSNASVSSPYASPETLQVPRYTTPEMGLSELQASYPQLFDDAEIIDPGFLAEHVELWPNGPPSDGGSTSWPVLPRLSPSGTPEGSSPMSVTKAFLDLSSMERWDPGSEGQLTRRNSSTQGFGEGASDTPQAAPDSDVEMEDAQSDYNRGLTFENLDAQQWSVSSSQRRRPSIRPVYIMPLKVGKDSLRKTALRNAMTAKKSKQVETKARKSKAKQPKRVNGK